MYLLLIAYRIFISKCLELRRSLGQTLLTLLIREQVSECSLSFLVRRHNLPGKQIVHILDCSTAILVGCECDLFGFRHVFVVFLLMYLIFCIPEIHELIFEDMNLMVEFSWLICNELGGFF